MLRLSLATVILPFFVFPLLASAASPPSQVILIEPPNEVEVNTTITFGWVQPKDAPHYYGFIQSVNISAYASNGTNIGSIAVDVGEDDQVIMDCGYYPGTTYGGYTTLPEAGTYTVVWNFTYIMSAEPQKANASSCGPAPFSTQIFLLNRTVEAAVSAGRGGVGAYTDRGFTATTTLPAQPTGDLKSAGAAGVWVPGAAAMLGVAAAVGGMVLAL